jgi:hypothetical protein
MESYNVLFDENEFISLILYAVCWIKAVFDIQGYSS